MDAVLVSDFLLGSLIAGVVMPVCFMLGVMWASWRD